MAQKKTTKKKATKKTAAKKKAASKKKTSTAAPAPAAETAAGTALTGRVEDMMALATRQFRDMEKTFSDFMRSPFMHPQRWEWPRWGELTRMLEQQVPSVDVMDKDKEVIVRAEVPGMSKEDLDVSIAERMLTIKGSSRKEEEEEKGDYFRKEIRTGMMSRSVLLPADVDGSKAKATFEDGILTIKLPKLRASKKQQVAIG